MRKLRYVKLFESFGQRTQQEILSQENLEDTLAKFVKLKSFSLDSVESEVVQEIIIMIDAWADEKLGLKLYKGEGNLKQQSIKGTKEEIIEDLNIKVQEILRFCRSGKYFDQTVMETLQSFNSVFGF